MGEIKLVYQDCYKCGAAKSWFATNQKMAEKLGLFLIPTPYYTPGASELIKKASKQNISLPFFTDGNRFAKTVSVFAPKTKIKKTGKVSNDEDTPEA